MKDSEAPKRPSFKLLLLSEFVIAALIVGVAVSSGILDNTSKSQVLSTEAAREEDSSIPSSEETGSSFKTVEEVSPTPKVVKKLEKNSYVIALYGDSMIDTMGDNAEYLDKALKERYPDTKFTFYNYGVGAQNVEDGINRLGLEFNYKDRQYPLLWQTNPDVIIVGSFAYNPFSPYDRDRHWLGLTNLLQQIQKMAPQVYMLAEISPLSTDFGRGPQGVNWDTQTATIHSKHIVEQLENAMGLAKTLNIPLIDAYHESTEEGKVKKELVSEADGIHPSEKGHEFMAEKIAETLELK